ncbi:MAG: GDSL-type esterase/lipase family protein [Geminicoccaceae bacterium]
MTNKRRRASARAIQTVAASALGLAAVLPSTPAKAAYTVFNPYVPTQSTYNRVTINRLFAFGDSYTDGNYLPFNTWAENMLADGSTSRLSNFAVAGATAFDGPTASFDTNSFRMQLDRLVQTGLTYKYQDLTVVYFGHNDSNRITDLTQAKIDYTEGVDFLINRGATGSKRRMLLANIHNIARDPSHSFRAAANVPKWNQHVANVANARKNVIAVDLYTAFERVYANPSRYGFVNVTTANSARDQIDYLYYDGYHIGERGQKLIQQVFKHYLTRGWDWSNTLATGSQTVARLNSDITAGQVFQTFSLTDEQNPLGIAPIGNLALTGSDSVWQESERDESSVAFATTPTDESPDGGLAMTYRLDDSTKIAFLLGDYDESFDDSSVTGAFENSTRSRASGFILDHSIGGFSFSTSVIYSADQYSKTNFDDFVGDSVTANFDGNTMRIGQQVRYGIDAGALTWTPWAELSYTRQDVDSFTVPDPYVSDLTYDMPAVEDTMATLGIAVSAKPFDLGDWGFLSLRGGLSYTHGLSQDDYQVTITESAQGYQQQETVERENMRSLGFDLGASWDMGQTFGLQAGYRAASSIAGSNAGDIDHAITGGFSLRF